MNLEEAIIATLAYHDIFKFPLNREELGLYLINKKAKPETINKKIANLVKSKKVGERNGYFYLKGHSKITTIRSLRKKYSAGKLKKAIFYAKVLKFIPTLKLVAITGALSMENSHKGDDIDLFLITAKGSMWTTRFLASILLGPFRRVALSKNTANKACLNMFIDESNLKLSSRSLYLAHEICQMKVIWAKGDSYKKFLNANKWIYEYLPNWIPKEVESAKDLSLITYHLSLVEPLEALAKWGQLWYMHSKVTTEKIGDKQLFFHPRDTEGWIMKEYKSRLKRLKIR